VSQRRLGENLRTLYEQGDTDPLAVMLGAQSLDDAITRLDDLTRVADQSTQVIAVTSAAQLRLARARTTLARRRAQLDIALAAARRTAGDLVAARGRRLAFISHLRNEQRLTNRQISTLQLAAQQVEAKSQKLQSAAEGAPAETPADLVSPAAVLPAAEPGSDRSITVSSTGYALPGHTATGIPVGWGVVAVDPAVIPLGTRLTIPGYGEAVAADTGSAVRGATIDLWFPTLAQARAWGRRTVTITLH
jgi:3D (Asp-Asp-Asp) domain-containing protein